MCTNGVTTLFSVSSQLVCDHCEQYNVQQKNRLIIAIFLQYVEEGNGDNVFNIPGMFVYQDITSKI